MDPIAFLKAQILELIGDGEKAVAAGELEKWDEIKAQLDEKQAKLKALETLAEAKALVTPTNGKAPQDKPLPLSPDDPPDAEPTAAQKALAHKAEVFKSIQIARYGDIDANADFLTREVLGQDYNAAIWAQEDAFKAYIRVGVMAGREHMKALSQQIWSSEDVLGMVKAGYGVGEVKATMVEGTDILGGYAVPPQRANRILRRIRGLTAIRGGGALIVQTSSNMIQWIKITGGGDSYPSALRGAWGSEAISPEEDDFSIGLEQIPVEIYTYRVPFSTSLLEDAVNIVPIFMGLVADTLAEDEDEVFVVGTGAGEPRGIMPAGTPDTDIATLEEGVTGTAGEITVANVKLLRRQIASQYRRQGRASWVMASATAGVIETFQDGEGRFYYQYLESGEQFLRSPVRETEFVPAAAASSYPIIYGDLSGYAIIERLGLSIVRYNDSNTGINKVEFHIRRRIGGRVIEPWKLAALRAASA